MPHPISLIPRDAACLAAIRDGRDRTMMIAVTAGLDLDQTAKALRQLAALKLAASDGHGSWQITCKGREAEISVVSPLKRRAPARAFAPTSTIGRMLALLDRPRHGAELSALLGVSYQRVHQMIVALLARGLIRTADLEAPLFAIARADDPTPLLRKNQQRLLSAFPEAPGATTCEKLASATDLPVDQTAVLADELCAFGLLEPAGSTAWGDLLRLTAAGMANGQRSPIKYPAGGPLPRFCSDRVRDVLLHFEAHGPTRTRVLGRRLGLEMPTIDKLMGSLRRRNVVRTISDRPAAPYDLTPFGKEILAAMRAVVGQ
jgi:hypothetical protein